MTEEWPNQPIVPRRGVVRIRRRCAQLSLTGLIDALDALCLILAGLDVLIAAGAHRHMRQKRLFHPFTMPLKGLRWEVHRCNNTTS